MGLQSALTTPRLSNWHGEPRVLEAGQHVRHKSGLPLGDAGQRRQHVRVRQVVERQVVVQQRARRAVSRAVLDCQHLYAHLSRQLFCCPAKSVLGTEMPGGSTSAVAQALLDSDCLRAMACASCNQQYSPSSPHKQLPDTCTLMLEAA